LKGDHLVYMFVDVLSDIRHQTVLFVSFCYFSPSTVRPLSAYVSGIIYQIVIRQQLLISKFLHNSQSPL